MGYSFDYSMYWLDGLVKKGVDIKNMQDAGTAGWLQPTLYYFKDNAYSLIPHNDEYFRTNQGYWIYAYSDELYMTLVGSSSDSYLWTDVQVANASTQLSLADAVAKGWLQSTIYYFDENSQYYKLVPGDDDYIYPWRGYWLYSNVDNLQLILP
jgi:hypothetical protein